MDQATLIRVRDECRKDFERMKAEYGDSQSAADELWGLERVEEIVTRLLKEVSEPNAIGQTMNPTDERGK